MMHWNTLPSSFRFAVRDTGQEDTVAVFNAVNGRLRNSGKKVTIAPFAKANMDQVARIIARLRTRERPDIEYITNQFIDVHRSSGRSHVVGALMTNAETQGDHFDLTDAASQGLANRVGNCDRVNAAANRMITLFDIRDPVLFYWTTAGNHNVSLIGDPRMAKYGERNTVVLDPYVVFPMAHTLAEASYDMRIPQEAEAGVEALEVWDPQNPDTCRFDTQDLPDPISNADQRAWLRARGWPEHYGADVVKAWHATELRETGQAPDRWEYLFSCQDPSVCYSTGEGPYEAVNRFPTRFVEQRAQALVELDERFPEAAPPSSAARQEAGQSLPARPTRTSLRSAARNDAAGATSSVTPSMADVHSNPKSGLSFQHLTPMNTVVTDLHTGEVVMEIHGSQIPVDRVNHGFPIKDPQKPWAIHPEYVSETDPFRCHHNVRVGHIELLPQTEAIMCDYFPVAAAEPGYFVARAAEIKAEYDAPLNEEKPPSALCWTPKRLIAQECYNDAQISALVGTFGVVAVDDGKQNVGGMGPAFAGAEINTAAQRRQYIAQTSKAAFDDFSMRTGHSNDSSEPARFAPYGGGNLAQFMNGKATPEDQAHFIAVDVIVHTINKFGEPRRVVAPHFFQIAEVPTGKQAILDYGDGYFYEGKRPGMSLQDPANTDPVKIEPTDDDLNMSEVPLSKVATSQEVATQPTRSGGKRLAPPGSASERRVRRLRPSSVSAFNDALAASSSTGLQGSSTTRGLQALTIGESDDDLSSLSSAPDTDMEDGGFTDGEAEHEQFDGGETAAAGARAGKQPSKGRHRRDKNIIDRLPPGMWEQARVMAGESRLPEGVAFRKPDKTHPTPQYRSQLRAKPLGAFHIIPPGRDNAKARALAIAVRLEAEAHEGSIRVRKDEDLIDEFGPELWKKAQALAKMSNRWIGISQTGDTFSAVTRVDGKPTSFGSFSITEDRDEIRAKALAIATWEMKMQRGVMVVHDVEQKDQAIIDNLPGGMWELAVAAAEKESKLSGISCERPKGRTSVVYIPWVMVGRKRKKLASFSVMEGRNELKARALAIAKRWEAEEAQAKAD